jgi:hypothetical protein
VIDPVSSPLLDDSAPSLACHVASGAGSPARFVQSFAGRRATIKNNNFKLVTVFQKRHYGISK